MSVFDSAISSLGGADDSAPESFINYWERTGQRGRPRTADHISVQTLAGLDAALARQRLFPFRLGRSADRGTAFALARSQALNDFFLEDSEVFPLKAVDLGTDLSPLQVFQFLLFTKQVEVNTVNLAVASGAIHRALRLDADTLRVSPASIASTFSFRVRPTVRDVVHAHDRGQVEIDAALIAKREGRPVVLVVEAKHGDASEKAQSLAKTKITYPLSAVLSGGQVPPRRTRGGRLPADLGAGATSRPSRRGVPLAWDGRPARRGHRSPHPAPSGHLAHRRPQRGLPPGAASELATVSVQGGVGRRLCFLAQTGAR